MTADIGAAADIATGALIGRAFEPHAGEAHGTGQALCLNCGTRLTGAYCHACGQSGHVHRTVGAIGHEIAHGVFHFEGKIWRTLPLLLLHPGTLTRRYVNGERARFVSPLALFLFTVFLLFATISWVGGEMPDHLPAVRSNDRAELARQIDQRHAEIAKLQAQRAAAIKAGQPTTDFDTSLLALRMTARGLEAAAGNKPGKDDEFTFSDMKTGWARLDHGIDKANENPGLAIYKLQSSAYKYSWALIPLSVPFVALLFLWRRRYNLYDHAIFVTYSLAFMMLMVTALTIGGVAGVPKGLIVWSALLLPPIHMFAQVRGAYSLRKRSAAWRTVALLMFAWTVLTAFLVLLLLHGLTE